MSNGASASGARERLLAIFPEVSDAEWRALVESELAGAPFERKLVEQTYEGIAQQPIYTRMSVGDRPAAATLPGQAPFLRGTHASVPGDGPWLVLETIRANDPHTANQDAMAALEQGVTALDLAPADPQQLAILLHNITADAIGLVLHPPLNQALALAQQLASLAGTTAHGALVLDTLADLATSQASPTAGEWDTLAALTTWAAEQLPHVQTINIDVRTVHEQGGSAVDELASAMATAVTQVRALLERGVPIATIAGRMRWTFAVGSRMFLEIAKLRAARLLWNKLATAFGAEPAQARLALHASGALRTYTLLDRHVNMLRGTAMAFAGAVGGVDSMEVAPFDAPQGSADHLAWRMAINTQHLLHEESQLGEVLDPGGGSWYLEALTDDLARKAWALFQEIEQQGGILAARELIAKRIASTAAQRARNMAARRDVLVGTSMYANPSDTLPVDAPTGTGRAAEPYEALRRRAAQLKPHVFLANLGPLSQHRARADFSLGFLQVGGLTVHDNAGFTTPAAAAAAALESQAQVVVICSSDPTYPELVPPLVAAIRAQRPQTVIVLAGYPQDQIEAHRASGVDAFIHLRSDVPATLNELFDRIEQNQRGAI